MSIYNIHSVIVHIPMYCHKCNSLRKSVPKILRQLNVIYTITFKLSTTVIHTVVGTASIKAISQMHQPFLSHVVLISWGKSAGAVLHVNITSPFIMTIKLKENITSLNVCRFVC